MDKRIVIKNEDGTCGIMSLAPEARGQILVEAEKVIKGSITPAKRNKAGVITKEEIVVEDEIIPAVYRDETDEEFINRIAAKDVPAGLSWRVVDISAIPEDRTFRNAWTDDKKTQTVDVDFDRAKEVWKDKLRADRTPLLKDLDAKFMRAVESGDTDLQASIAADKQELCDITNAVDSATTLEAIKAITVE